MKTVPQNDDLKIDNDEVVLLNATPAADAATTPGTTDILSVIRSHTKERKSTELKGTITGVQFFQQTDKQKSAGIVNGVCGFKTEGGQTLEGFRFTTDVEKVGSVAKPEINEGDEATFSIRETGNDYGYSSRLVSHRPGMTRAQRQQMEMVKKLGLTVSIAVG